MIIHHLGKSEVLKDLSMMGTACSTEEHVSEVVLVVYHALQDDREKKSFQLGNFWCLEQAEGGNVGADQDPHAVEDGE